MDNELEKKLVDKYPVIFKNRYTNPLTHNMGWGIECGSGWYMIIDCLCESIQQYVNGVSYTGRIAPVIANQIKEKYGTLRFYYEGGDEFVDGMVDYAENMSGHICENCGSPEGKIKSKMGWLKCRCSNCEEKANVRKL